jgi:hypothetical protein
MFSRCCQGGKVELKDFKEPPEQLWQLFTAQDPGMSYCTATLSFACLILWVA